jgi:hypothetical protein
VVESDHVNFQRQPGHFLRLDALHPTDAVRWVNNVISDREIMTDVAHGQTFLKCARRLRAYPSVLIYKGQHLLPPLGGRVEDDCRKVF